MLDTILDRLQNDTGSHAYCLVGDKLTSQSAIDRISQELKISASESYYPAELPITIAEARKLISWFNQRPLSGSKKLITILIQHLI